MSDNRKIFVCQECGHVFPSELSTYIEKKTQVYCEKCGSPFSLEGVAFKPSEVKPRRTYQRRSYDFKSRPRGDTTNWNNIIQNLNKFSWIPVLIFAIVAYVSMVEIVWNPTQMFQIISSRTILGSSSLIIALYDKFYISPRVEEKKYNEIMLHSFCWGIIGCVIFGIGTIILIKGLFIFFYVISDEENRELKTYDYGLLMIRSLNNFGAVGGLVIVLLGLNLVFLGALGFSFPSVIVFMVLSSIALLVALVNKNILEEKEKFEMGDFLQILIIGIIGVLFAAAGIFILLAGVLIFFMLFGEPTKKTPAVPIAVPIRQEEKKEIEAIPMAPIQKPPEEQPIFKEEEKKKMTPKDLRKETKLKIHESLLPIKDKKDKELITEYFTKIFAVISNDLRNQVLDLKISKKEKKDLLKELAFLSAEDQIKYVDGLVNMYQEIPIKLVNRIKKLPNVKPKHYGKIIQQLKFMDMEEQIKFVMFLEENA